MSKTYDEINARIRKGEAVVVTAEEMIDVVAEEGVAGAAKKVDVVTTATFGAMCSSGLMLNFGHAKPRIKLGGGTCTLNGIEAYCGLAAVDAYLGATAMSKDDPRNEVYPGEFRYGGGHVIEDLVAGKEVHLKGTAYGTDCYPNKGVSTWIKLDELNQALLWNPRNCYQNYNVAVNSSDRPIYTYMGALQPGFGNATYSSAGQLSPLLNDPLYRTIGIGTRIFLGGGVGYVVFAGTQHDPSALRDERGVPKRGAGTLALMGDLKGMSAEWLRGASFQGYGCTLYVGVGIPIPILDEELAAFTSVRDDQLTAGVMDYATSYPAREPKFLGEVTYTQLKTGSIEVAGKQLPTAPLSSYPRAVVLANLLKGWIQSGNFQVSAPVDPLPGPESGMTAGPMAARPEPGPTN